MAGMLDQEFLPASQSSLVIQQSQTVAQTFEVGLSGVLDRVDVEVGRYGALAGGITLEVRSTLPGGLPADTVLASAFIAVSDITTSWPFYQSVELDLSSFDVRVAEGDLLAMVLSSGTPDEFVWRGDHPGGYTRGQVYFDVGGGFLDLSGWDMGFRTYVDTTPIPEPTALSLLSLGALVLVSARRREDGVAGHTHPPLHDKRQARYFGET